MNSWNLFIYLSFPFWFYFILFHLFSLFSKTIYKLLGSFGNAAKKEIKSLIDNYFLKHFSALQIQKTVIIFKEYLLVVSLVSTIVF